MILQQYPLHAFNDAILKQYYQKLNMEPLKCDFTPSYRGFIFDRTRSLMFDLVNDSALIFDKVDINDIISYPVDISKFEVMSGQLNPPTEADNEVLKSHTTPLEIVDRDIRTTSIYNNTKIAITKFNVFVKIVGLVDLTPNDVYLAEDDGDLAITVAEIHPVLTGTLRIKTW